MDKDSIKQDVRNYYGKELKGSKDLRTSACCCSGECIPQEVKDILPLIDSEILDRFYGCGSPIPQLLTGLTVLDLGCGTGRDVYIISKLVGEAGRAIGVDMTSEQLEVARSHEKSQMSKFGYARSNVDFHLGYIEDLASLGIEDNSIDVVVSNCVINLSPEKEKVFSEIYRVLKKGGELYFSDIFADRRVPDSVYADPIVHGECLGGAMYIEDFRRMMSKVGFEDYRVVSESPVDISDEHVKSLVGDTGFKSVTVRAFKVDGLEDRCEDYGQSVIYKGTIPGKPEYFDLDSGHRFETNKPKRVCGNTAAMIAGSRFATHFTVSGDRRKHYGQFDCSDNDVPCKCCCC